MTVLTKEISSLNEGLKVYLSQSRGPDLEAKISKGPSKSSQERQACSLFSTWTKGGGVRRVMGNPLVVLKGAGENKVGKSLDWVRR